MWTVWTFLTSTGEWLWFLAASVWFWVDHLARVIVIAVIWRRWWDEEREDTLTEGDDGEGTEGSDGRVEAQSHRCD